MATASRDVLLKKCPPTGGRRAVNRIGATNLFLAGMESSFSNCLSRELPRPQVQIRCFSAWQLPSIPSVQKTGYVAGAGLPRPAQGPLSTPNFLRLGFEGPLPLPLLALNPEIWLFTNQCPSLFASGTHSKGSWEHPAHSEQRDHSHGLNPGNATGRVTEFSGPTVQQSLALSSPHVNVVIDSNHWFGHESGSYTCKLSHCTAKRFRFAMVLNTPPERFPELGKVIGPLSCEVWLKPTAQCNQSYAFYESEQKHPATYSSKGTQA